MAVDLETEGEEVTRDVADQRKEFHEARASIIGATDSPKILGFSKYGTALTVYNDKVNPDTSDRQMSLPAWLGLKMQATVGELYAEKMGTRLRAANRLVRMPGVPWIGCHLDFRAWGKPNLLVECKTKAYMSGWGEDLTSKIPVGVWVQVQHEMMVTGAPECHIAVLFGHHTFRVYVVPRDEEFIAGLIVKLTEFREQNWLPRVPPLPTGHHLDTELVKQEHPEHTDDIKAITPEQADLVKRFKQARINAAQANLAEAEAKNRLRELIGDAAGITGTFGTITLKRTKDSIETTWSLVAQAYRTSVEELLGVLDRIKDDDPDDWEKVSTVRGFLDAIEPLYTTVKPGYRRFHIQFADEEEE